VISSILSVVTPAASLGLLSAAELRAAAGLGAEDKSQDEALEALGLEAAEWIAGTICGMATAGGNSPTLLQESLSEAFRLRSYGHRLPRQLILSRRVVSDVDVTENDTALVADTDFLVHDEAGLLDRLSSDVVTCWPSGTIVVTYTAGFAADAVPAVVKAVATDFIRMRLSQRGRDPLVRSETTEGVDSVTYRDGAGGETDFEEAARSRLARYMNSVFA
jgi:hypothetical protein